MDGQSFLRMTYKILNDILMRTVLFYCINVLTYKYKQPFINCYRVRKEGEMKGECLELPRFFVFGNRSVTSGQAGPENIHKILSKDLNN